MPINNSPHPGDFIRTEITEPAGLSVTAAAAARQGGIVRRHGPTDRESVRREDGHADANAIRLRHRANPQAREGNPCAADSPIRRGAVLAPIPEPVAPPDSSLRPCVAAEFVGPP